MSDGSPLLRELVAVGADGRFTKDLELRENDVYLLSLTRPRGGAGESPASGFEPLPAPTVLVEGD